MRSVIHVLLAVRQGEIVATSAENDQLPQAMLLDRCPCPIPMSRIVADRHQGSRQRANMVDDCQSGVAIGPKAASWSTSIGWTILIGRFCLRADACRCSVQPMLALIQTIAPLAVT